MWKGQILEILSTSSDTSHSAENQWKRKGLFLNPLILETFALHFHETENAHDEAATMQEFKYPIGALALSTSAVSD